MRAHLAFVILLVLVACAPGTSARLAPGDGFAPGAAPGKDPDVDPLIVADRLLAAGEAELALDNYKRAAVRDGLSADLLVSMSAANVRLGRLNQAEMILREVLTEEPEHIGALNNLGVVLLEQGNYGESERTFRQAFALDSGNTPEIRENLRVALAKLENPSYTPEQSAFTLVNRGSGVVSLVRTKP
jgi:tetratricopeptide (TPR) repeat protein